jgi:hypothetical protein
MLFFIRLGLIFICRHSIPHKQAINKHQKRSLKSSDLRCTSAYSLFRWPALSSLTETFTVLSFNLPPAPHKGCTGGNAQPRHGFKARLNPAHLRRAAFRASSGKPVKSVTFS